MHQPNSYGNLGMRESKSHFLNLFILKLNIKKIKFFSI